MALPESLQGDRWTEAIARRIFPILVWCATHDKRITYGQLDEELQRRGWGHHVNVVVYGHPAGAIGNSLIEFEQQTGRKIPPLNSLIVNASTGIPGSGCDYYLSFYLNDAEERHLTLDDRKAMAEETIQEVFKFQEWPQILRKFGLPSLSGGVPSLKSKLKPRAPKKTGWSTGPESQEHKRLKEWIARNPSKVGKNVPKVKGKLEWLFASADRVDVMFQDKSRSVAVEVKARSASDAELERGIYQAVKYSALIRAELKAAQKIPNGSCVLVTERPLPSTLIQLADLLGVYVVSVDID
ncbi:hypothetical protein [Rhodopseudomonas sp. BR0M22]|uniref:hypothetical protein n=1 Tax=Rhodopseudomonas sp. BR0M22 TaxID=2269369 RepID=UPI0013DF2FC7|nr:hypothetical protein [Rhodopseudomonas sp. BR0M22]